MDPSWIELYEMEVLIKANTEATLNFLLLGTSRLTDNTNKPEKV